MMVSITPPAPRSYTYTVLLWPDPALGQITATVPSLPGCVAQGPSREAVLDLIQSAIQMHIEGLIEDGDEVPVEDSPVQTETVTIAA